MERNVERWKKGGGGEMQMKFHYRHVLYTERRAVGVRAASIKFVSSPSRTAKSAHIAAKIK